MHDTNTECLHDCPGCKRCNCCDECGTTEGLVMHNEKHYCPECLAEILADEADSVVSRFVNEHFDLFVKHVATVC